MQARALLKHLRWTSVLLVFLVHACVATSAPRIRACGASSGALRILPSTVPGAEIDSAYWNTHAGTQDIGVWEQLVYHSRLRVSRGVRRSEFAILYEPGESWATVDADVFSVPIPREMSGLEEVRHADLHVVDTTTTTRVVQSSGGFRVGKSSSIRYCPRTVQLVARGDVPFLLMPRLASASVRSTAAQSAEAHRSPLVVVKDTLLRVGGDVLDANALAWAAINVGDTTLTDMVVALVVVGPASVLDPSTHGAARAVEDTIEYHVGPVAARGRVGFVGAELRYGEAIVERISYPAARVTGRVIPPKGEMGRVSQARAGR
jgi:hypothetical protein